MHRAVVVGGDQPLPVPFLEDPGRVDLAGICHFGLARKQDAGFADGDRSVGDAGGGESEHDRPKQAVSPRRVRQVVNGSVVVQRDEGRRIG